jgi:hypothetical protein
MGDLMVLRVLVIVLLVGEGKKAELQRAAKTTSRLSGLGDVGV